MTAKPKWRKRWDELTTDPATGKPFSYLEIKGWYKWQEKHYTTDYIRDYFGKDEDPDYGSPEVRVIYRWMMDWLRRQRGRMRHTLPNDPDFLLRRMNLGKEDANQAGWAMIGLLEGCGAAARRLEIGQAFLIPTNEPVRDQKWVNKTKANENNLGMRQEVSEQEKTMPELPPVQPSSGSPVQQTTQPPPKPNGYAHRKPPAPVRPVQAKKLGFDPHEINEPMAGYTVEEIRKIVRYHWDESEASFWRDKTRSREFFERNLEKMAEQIPIARLDPKKPKKQSFMHGNW